MKRPYVAHVVTHGLYPGERSLALRSWAEFSRRFDVALDRRPAELPAEFFFPLVSGHAVVTFDRREP